MLNYSVLLKENELSLFVKNECPNYFSFKTSNSISQVAIKKIILR